MGQYREIEGDLITLAKAGEFDVIAHGCNCQCRMGAGIAPLMAKAFGCDKYVMENKSMQGEFRKMGNIDYDIYHRDLDPLFVVNAYTQFQPGPNLDIEALILCMRKINYVFRGKHIGLPKIGCGLAGGDWSVVSFHIKRELKDCQVTVVILKQ